MIHLGRRNKIAHALSRHPADFLRPCLTGIVLLIAALPKESLCAETVSRAELAAFKPEPAQSLVDNAIADNPDLLDVLLHVTPPGGRQNLVVASHIPANLGEISGADDLGVFSTGKPLVEVQKDGVRIGVLLQMFDEKKRPIGAIGIMFPWHSGDKQSRFLTRAKSIRNTLAKQIPSLSALFG